LDLEDWEDTGESMKEFVLRIIGETKSIALSRARSSDEGPWVDLSYMIQLEEYYAPGVGRPT